MPIGEEAKTGKIVSNYGNKHEKIVIVYSSASSYSSNIASI